MKGLIKTRQTIVCGGNDCPGSHVSASMRKAEFEKMLRALGMWETRVGWLCSACYEQFKAARKLAKEDA